jgi:hypothetical protein
MHPNPFQKVTVVELNSEYNGYKFAPENVLFQINLGGRSDAQMLHLLNGLTRQEYALRLACQWQLSEIQNAKDRLEDQEQIANERKCRADRAERLLGALIPIIVVYLMSARVGLPLFVLWLAVACVVYIPRLMHLAGGMKLPKNRRTRTVLLVVLEHFENQLQRLSSRLRAS